MYFCLAWDWAGGRLDADPGVLTPDSDPVFEMRSYPDQDLVFEILSDPDLV